MLIPTLTFSGFYTNHIIICKMHIVIGWHKVFKAIVYKIKVLNLPILQEKFMISRRTIDVALKKYLPKLLE